MRVALGASLFVLGACEAFGQPAEPAPAFDVASVRVSAPAGGERGSRRDVVTPSPAGVTMTNVTLKSVVQWAYHLQSVQVTGPGWIDSDRYDITAKASGPVSTERLRAMAQTLLAERFKLVCHKETREMPAYVVSIAKGGHKLKQSEGEGEMQVKPNGARMSASFTHVTLA